MIISRKKENNNISNNSPYRKYYGKNNMYMRSEVGSNKNKSNASDTYYDFQDSSYWSVLKSTQEVTIETN